MTEEFMSRGNTPEYWAEQLRLINEERDRVLNNMSEEKSIEKLKALNTMTKNHLDWLDSKLAQRKGAREAA